MPGAHDFHSKIKNVFFGFNLALTFFYFFIMSYSFSRPLRQSIANFTGNTIIVITVYFFLFYFFYFVFIFPLRYLEGFIFENRLRDKKQEFQIWLKGLIQKEIRTFSLLLIGVQVIYFFLETNLGFWWVHMTVLSIVVLNAWDLLSNLVVPYYSRHQDLSDKRLYARIMKLFDGARLRVLRIFIYKDSKAKAVIVGLDDSRQLILSDAVLKYAPEEIEVLVALEIAKNQRGYIWKKTLIEAIGMLVIFFLVHFSFAPACDNFGLEFIFNIETLPVLLGLFFVYFVAIWFAVNYFKRQLNKENDLDALRLSRVPEAFVSLIIRDTQQGAQGKQAVSFFEEMFFSNSPVSRRIMLAQDYAQNMLFENMHKV